MSSHLLEMLVRQEDSLYTKFSLVSGSQMTTTNAQSAYSFAGVPIGTADTSRLVIIAFGSKGATLKTTTGVTIGGVTATKIIERTVNRSCVSIYAAIVPTGTTATININWSGSVLGFQGDVYTIYNKSAVTAFATASASNALATNTLNLNVPANGVGVAVSINEGVTPYTWSAPYTESVDYTNANPFQLSTAFVEYTTATTSTASYNITTAAQNAIAAASWAY